MKRPAGIEQTDRDGRIDLVLDAVCHHPHLDADHRALGAEAAHAVTMALLALTGHRWRRPAVVSGLIAAAFAALGATAARRAAKRPAHRDPHDAI